MPYKVILADDEKMLRDGLDCLVDWRALDCQIVLRAANGQDVVSWLESHEDPVDLIVSDIKMPVMDGLQVAEYVSVRCADTTEVILLTAFADFSYAQSAIRFNVCDFVLKSRVVENLPTAVEKAKQSLRQKEEQRQRLLDADTLSASNSRNHLERLLLSVAHGQSETPDPLFASLYQPLYLIASYEIASAAPLTSESTRPAILNVLSMCLREYEAVSVCVSPSQYASLLRLPETEAALRDLMKNLHRIISVLTNYTQYGVRVGLSERKRDPAALPAAFQESIAALNQLFNDHHSLISVYNRHNDSAASRAALPDVRGLIDRVSEWIQAGQMEEMATGLKQYFEDFLRSGEPIETLKLAALMTYTSLTVNVGLVDMMDQWGEQADEQFYQTIESARTIRIIHDALINHLRRYASLRQSAAAVKNNLIRQVNAYIHAHYAENINLQTIADTFHISCGYLGRLYRREAGMSLVVALNKRRIDVAKRLLKTTGMKVFEVAHAVGIDDPTYFTHIFAKYTGQSPSTFRNEDEG